MAQTLEELVVKIAADTGQLRSEMLAASKVSETATTNIQKSINDMASGGTKDLSLMDQAFATLTGVVGGEAILGAFEKLKEVVGFFTDQLKESMVEMTKEESALQGLANALALSGNYTEKNQKQLEAFGEQMELLTGITPKQTAANLALLESMTHLSVDGLEKAEKAAGDLAVAYNMDLDSAVRLIGKGIEGNVEAFKRYGIEVKDAGSRAGNLSNILKALQGAHGSAEGAMKTFAGQQILLNKHYEDMFEAVAKVVTQNAVVKAMMAELGQIFGDTADAAEDSSLAMKQGLGQTLIQVAEALEFMASQADVVVRSLDGITAAVGTAMVALEDSGKWLLDGFAPDAEEAFERTKKAWDYTTDTFDKDSSLTNLSDAFGKIKDAGKLAFDSITKSGEAAKPTVKGATSTVIELTAAQKAYNDQLASFATGLADQGSAITGFYENDLAMLDQQHDAKLISTQEYFDESLQQLLDAQDAEDTALEDAHEKGLINESRYQDAKNALMSKQNKQASDFAKKFTDLDKAEQKERLSNMSDTFGQIATLSESSNKTLAAIGKAAAISQATIDGILAVQKTLATIPYPASIPLAALVGVAAAANVAKIAGVQLATGIDSVPGVGSKDNFPAILAPGERVVPKKTNEDLTAFLQNQSQGGSGGQNITLNLNITNSLPASREAGAAMIESINEAIANGSLKILGMK